MNKLIILGDWTEFVYCDKDEICKEKFGNTIETKCLADVSLGKGVCVPKNCQDKSDCPKIGNSCTSGELTIRKCSYKNQCQYQPYLTKPNLTGCPNPGTKYLLAKQQWAKN